MIRKKKAGNRGERGKKKPPAGRREAVGSFEYTFLVTVTLMLLAVGVVMVFSASWANAYFGNQDSYFYLKRELIYALIGLVLMFALARFDFMRLRKLSPLLMLVSVGLLVLVFIPGFGSCAKGACRWLGFGPFTFQPSELAKLSTVLFVAAVLQSRPRLLASVKDMLLPLLALPAVACVLILVEPDMGTAIAIMVTVAAMLFIAGTRLRDLALMGAVTSLAALPFIILFPYRMARITAFINPWQDARDSGFQVIQSLVALGSGGLFGVGIGKSIQKFSYLPEAHTDMILSIIGEEMGLIGVLVIIAAYAALAYVGFRIALQSKNLYGKYVAGGITSLLISQAVINACAVMGLLPLTGIPLPIISYGGSSLVVILSSIGILLNIAVNPRGKIAARPSRKFRAIEGGNRSRGHGRAPGSRSGAGRRAQG
ncbi:lipid II flippase FtsW [bacterium BMS3Abin01]|nr:lipid II flippase FtsW [bacterium BMS3Abin01]